MILQTLESAQGDPKTFKSVLKCPGMGDTAKANHFPWRRSVATGSNMPRSFSRTGTFHVVSHLKDGNAGKPRLQKLGKSCRPLTVLLAHVREDKGGCPFKGGHRFTQIPSGKDSGVASQAIGIEQDEIHLSPDLKMLKTVIEQKNIGPQVDASGRESGARCR